MFTVGNLMRTHKGKCDDIDIQIDCDACYTRVSLVLRSLSTGKRKIPKSVKRYGIGSWTVGDPISVVCDLSTAASKSLSVANLCGTCANKDIFVSVNGAEKKHIYSVHPVKDSKAVRRWWIDGDKVLHIRTWPWNAK